MESLGTPLRRLLDGIRREYCHRGSQVGGDFQTIMAPAVAGADVIFNALPLEGVARDQLFEKFWTMVLRGPRRENFIRLLPRPNPVTRGADGKTVIRFEVVLEAISDAAKRTADLIVGGHSLDSAVGIVEQHTAPSCLGDTP